MNLYWRSITWVVYAAVMIAIWVGAKKVVNDAGAWIAIPIIAAIFLFAIWWERKWPTVRR